MTPWRIELTARCVLMLKPRLFRLTHSVHIKVCFICRQNFDMWHLFNCFADISIVFLFEVNEIQDIKIKLNNCTNYEHCAIVQKFRRDLDPDQQTKHIRDRDDFTWRSRSQSLFRSSLGGNPWTEELSKLGHFCGKLVFSSSDFSIKFPTYWFYTIFKFFNCTFTRNNCETTRDTQIPHRNVILHNSLR